MKAAIAVLLWVTCVGAQTQPGPAQAAGAQAAKGAVSGKVVNAVTGEAVRKASVLLAAVGAREPQARTGNTDAEGGFAFTGLAPGNYRLLVTRTGFVRQAAGERASGGGPGSAGGVLALKPGEEVKDILIRLQPAAAISGRVADEDGEPLMHARVQALRWTYMRGRRELMPAGSNQSDDRGEYRIYNLSPGRYYVSASYEGGFVSGYLAGMGVNVTDQAYVPVFYPGVNDPTQASAVEVRGGDDVPGINFMIVPQRAVTVAGRVFNAVTGQAGRNVHVSLRLRSPTLSGFFEASATTDEQGMFRFRGVAPGAYIATAQWDAEGRGPGTVITHTPEEYVAQYSSRHYTGRQAVDVGSADVEGVSLVIAPGTDIAGAVKVEGTLPPSRPASSQPTETVVMGTRVLRSASSPQMRILLDPLEDGGFMGSVVATVNPDNTFVLSSVPEGAYRVTLAGAPGNAYLKTARMGGADVLEDGLVVTRGRRGTLEVVVSTLTGSVEGVALDSGKPFAGARVVLVPEGARRKVTTFYRLGLSDAAGHFSLRSVPPGDYKLFAWDTIETGAWQDPEFLRPFEDQGQLVHITENGQQTAELKVIVTQAPVAQ